MLILPNIDFAELYSIHPLAHNMDMDRHTYIWCILNLLEQLHPESGLLTQERFQFSGA